MHKPKVHPELQMQYKIASGLATQTCQYDKPCDDLAQYSFPGEQNSEIVHLNSPPQVNLQLKPNVKTQDPSITQPEGNSTYLSNKI